MTADPRRQIVAQALMDLTGRYEQRVQRIAEAVLAALDQQAPTRTDAALQVVLEAEAEIKRLHARVFELEIALHKVEEQDIVATDSDDGLHECGRLARQALAPLLGTSDST